jgi:hypothetical protein
LAHRNPLEVSEPVRGLRRGRHLGGPIPEYQTLTAFSRVSLFNLLRGGGPLGELTVSTEDDAWVDGILADEMFGVAFMIAGTLIWAYGAFLIAWMGN